MLFRTAIALQGAGLLAVFAQLLLPANVELYGALVTGLLLMTPAGEIFEGRWWHKTRLAILYLGCAWILVFSPVTDWSSQSMSASETALLCAVVWTIFLTSIEAGACYGFPVAMLSCMCAALGLKKDPAGGILLIAFAALLLLVSGGLIFLDSLTHSKPRASRLSGTALWRVSPQALIAVMAFAVMLFTTGLSQTVLVKLGSRMPFPDRGPSDAFALESKAPEFSGETVCQVTALSGPMPRYLAEKLFWNYENGIWKGGLDCADSGNGYGIPRSSPAAPQTFGRCTVRMTDAEATLAVPFGILREDGSRKSAAGPVTASSSTSGNKQKIGTYSWSRYAPVRDAWESSKQALDTAELHRLELIAASVCQEAHSDRERIRRVVAHLESDLSYDARTTFRLDRSNLEDPTEHFLLNRKRGWCIHFASASTLMLRAVGVPARLVSGYLVVGDRKTVAIPDSYGHAWCEALVTSSSGKRQWIVVDPCYRSAQRAATSLDTGHWRMAVGVFIMLAVAVGVFAHGKRVKVKDLVDEMNHENDTLEEAERVVLAYERALRFFQRMGITKARSMPAGTFARTRVPEAYRADFMVLTKAFQRVTYMGYRKLGAFARDAFEAQKRLLSQKKRY